MAAEGGIPLSSVAILTLRCTAPLLSLDQKSEGRIQPRLPMKEGHAGNMTRDYVRQGTTTPLPAFIGSTAPPQRIQRQF